MDLIREALSGRMEFLFCSSTRLLLDLARVSVYFHIYHALLNWVVDDAAHELAAQLMQHMRVELRPRDVAALDGSL